MVRASAADTTPMVVQLIPLVVSKLQETLHLQGGGLEAAERQSEIQGLLCGMTQVIVQKLSDSESAKAGVLQVRRMRSGRAVGGCGTRALQCRWLHGAGCCCTARCGLAAAPSHPLPPTTHDPHPPHQFADHIMDALLSVFACRKTSVHEEAMLAVVRLGAGGAEAARGACTRVEAEACS